MHAQIVADTLGIPYDAVEVTDADTAHVPDSGPTVASRTCMVVGRLLQRAAQQMRERLGGESPAGVLPQARPVRGDHAVRDGRRDSSGTTIAISGDAYGSYGWGCNVVELEVDPRHVGGDAARTSPRSSRSARRFIP